MKRDMQLILTILRYVEQHWSGDDIRVVIEDYTSAQVYYHIGLCVEAKFLHYVHEAENEKYWIRGLTWAGHGFLDQNRERRTRVRGIG